jgi:hypothetical protein
MEAAVMEKILSVSVLSAMLISPAFAVAPEEYWVVQDATTKHCSVVAEKPMSPATAVGDSSFKSREEAERFSKTDKICGS